MTYEWISRVLPRMTYTVSCKCEALKKFQMFMLALAFLQILNTEVCTCIASFRLIFIVPLYGNTSTALITGIEGLRKFPILSSELAITFRAENIKGV